MKEVVDSKDSDIWKKAMIEEIDSLDKKSWDLVQLLARRNIVGNKWSFKNKLNVEGIVDKYKYCLVEKGYSQVEGIYFRDLFSLVEKLTSIRFLLSIAISFDIEVEKMGVKTTFLHGDI